MSPHAPSAERALPDSANVFNELIRHVEKEPMAVEVVPRKSDGNKPFDMTALWRLGAWGAAAIAALLLVAFISMSGTGSQRLGLAFAPAELPVRPVATVTVAPAHNDAEIKRMAMELQTLTADRDRVSARIASLEKQLDDLTGSIKRLADIPPPSSPPPAPSAPPPTPQSPAAVAPSISSPLAMPDATSPAPPNHADTAQPESVATVEEPSSDPVPIPPERTPAVSAATVEAPQSGFGVALAAASSLEIARLQWTAAKANFGSMLANLQPRAASERRGGAVHYRLVAGPLPTYTAASRLCARIVAAHAICQPVKFAGEPL